jgi:hypothetical protein
MMTGWIFRGIRTLSALRLGGGHVWETILPRLAKSWPGSADLKARQQATL